VTAMARRPLLVAVVVATAVALAIPAGAVIRPFAPQQTLVGGCASFDADAVTRSTGSVVGFATCPGPSGNNIRFFSRRANGTVNPSEATGFSGSVLGVADDGTATYVLFYDGRDIEIGKRTNAAAYSSRVVDAGVGTGEFFPSGDVIARNGQWFGAWTKRVGPGGDFAQLELFSAGSVVPVTQVTHTSGDVFDSSPTMAYSGSTPVLIWTRSTGIEDVPSADLYVSKYINGTWQATRAFATAGQINSTPDMHIAGGRTFVTWERDGFIWVASNPTGSFSSRRFNTGGFHPFVSASTTGGVVDHIFVAWTSFTGDRVFFAESATSGSVHMTWDGAHVGPAGSDAFAVRGFGTKATVVYGTGSSVASRTQS
jgi:hypothetical protein